MLAKMDQVTKLMEILSSDLSHVNLLPHRQHSLPIVERVLRLTLVERDAHLEQLKVLGREPANADPIFTKQVSSVWLGFRLYTDLDQGHRNTDSTCLQQPLQNHLAQCTSMLGECDAP